MTLPDRRTVLQVPLLAAALQMIPFHAASAAELNQAPGFHDFDLFAGSWRSHNKKLKKRLAGSHDWEEFDGTQTLWLALGGQANIDDNFFRAPSGAYSGATVRTFDPKTSTWAIYWLDSRFPHTIDAPQIGRFRNGVGEFLADDTLNGKPIKVRFIWSDVTANSRHWEQAFSPDGGTSWETNWICDFTRAA